MTLAEKLSKDKWKLKYLDKAEAEHDLSTTFTKTIAQGLLSGVVGGYIGHKIGKPAFLIGLLGTGLGHYFGVSWAPPVGMGMMAGSITASNSVSSGGNKTVGSLGAFSAEKDFANSLLERTYLDKLLHHFKKKDTNNTEKKEIAEKETDNTTEGIGSAEDEYKNALAKVEKDLYVSALQFKKQRGESTAGLEEEMRGINDVEI